MLRRLRCEVTLTQRQLPPYELGAAICYGRGRFALGPVSKGTRTKVDIKLSCPPGMYPIGTLHTHPGGLPFPSKTDIENLRRAGLKVACIVSEKGARCFLIDKPYHKRV